MSFQPNFLWGAGSSAYQTEGARDAAGKGLSIWDDFCHTPGHIRNGETGDTATDSYHKLKTDLMLIKKMGLTAYRFSISWPRVFPDGRCRENVAGLDYYDRLVEGLLDAGVTPFITLYHWDLPLALEREGGWKNRSTAEAFMEYAARIALHFDGKVRHYVTLNEPQCFIGMGYGSGEHAPGKKLAGQELAQCAHNALLAHGGAVAAMRAAAKSPLEIGLASTGRICYPVSEAANGMKAAYDATFLLKDIENDRGEKKQYVERHDWTFSHTWLLDAAVFGRYPDGIEAFRSLDERISEEDRRTIREPMDFIGLNIYNGIQVDDHGRKIKKAPGFPRTALKWPVTPECMYCGPRFLHERYGLPLYITENGLSCNDRIYLDGAVHDADRIDFLTRYLVQLKRAAADDIPVKGYFHWSLTDNFEWHSGYDERFGLVYVDYETQTRIIKDSGYWYRDMIKTSEDESFSGAG